MTYYEYPTKIPQIPGKITYRACRRSAGHYVLLETGRRYMSEKQYNLVNRATIGRTIPEMPGMMYPSARYLDLFRDELPEEVVRKMNQQDENGKRSVFIWNDNEDGDENNRKADFELLLTFLVQQKAVLQAVTERRPNNVVSAFIIQGLNAVLQPLREIMQDELYACFLPPLEEPKAVGKGEDRHLEGLTNLEVFMTLDRYETAARKYKWNFS